MTALRVHALSSQSPPAAARLRVHRITSAGAAPVTTKLRVHRITSAGVGGIALRPLADVATTALAAVTLTADLEVGSAAATTYTWRHVSGVPAAIIGTGASVTVTAPAGLDGTTTVIGVRASAGSVQSVERLVTITTLPHVWWEPTGTAWRPLRSPVPA